MVFKHRAFDLNICAFVLPVSEFMATCIGLLFLVCQSVTDFQRKRSSYFWISYEVPLCLSQRDPAYVIHVPYQRVNEIVNRRRGITPSTALRLARFFSTSADFWMNLQQSWDLYHAQLSENDDLQTIQPLKAVSAG